MLKRSWFLKIRFFISLAPMDEKLSLSLYSVQDMHCLLLMNTVIDIKPITYCERKIKEIECDIMVTSIIFRIGKYLNWN